MNFKPKKESELSEKYEQILLPAGEYDFTVTKATDKTSGNGNEMIEMKLDIHIPEGGKAKVYDYLLEAMHYKLKHFCEATNLVPQYETGSLTAALCTGRTGRCIIVIKADKNGTYADRNEVKDYCKPDINSSELAF